MKVCPLCGENYKPFVDFCFVDGEVLTLEQAVVEVPEPEGFDAPPPPKMLQGSQQSSGYTRSATPVPRARRPGRSLINRPESGGGVYSPPVAEEPFDAASDVASDAGEGDAFDDEVLEAPPLVDEVEEVQAFDDGFGEPEPSEPQPEPILPGRSGASSGRPRAETPQPLQSNKRSSTPVPANTPVPHEDEQEETGAMGLVLFGLAGIILIGLVGAVGALVVGTIFSSNGDDTNTVILPEPPVDPDPVPVPDPNPNPDPVQVGKVGPDGPDGTEPEPQPDTPEPVEPVEPVQPQPSVPDPVPPTPTPVPQPVVPNPTPRPDPNDGVTMVEPVAPRPRADVGRVVITSNPDRATIKIDGKAQGTTRFALDLPYGEHSLVLEKEGYESLETKFNLSVAELTLSTYSLKSLTPEPAPAPIAPRPTGEPRLVMFFHSETGIPVRVGGTTQGCEVDDGGKCVTPARFQLPVGEYTVEFTPSTGKKSCRIVVTEDSRPVRKLHEECP
ncbi:MAG: PEGA domain-containing protein [Myxococcota bacterium]